MIAITSTASLLMLLLFMQFGTAVLGFFGISISSFQIAGGILLGGVGLDMMNARLSNDVDIKAVDSSLVDRQNLDKAQLYASAVVPIALINPSLTATASAPAGIFALGEIIFALVKTFI